LILAFDFGTTRFGVAVGEALIGTATALKPIPAKEGIPDGSRLQALINEWQPEAFVVGLPLNMDGSLCEMSYRARKFANRLHALYDRPSYLMDERLTSHEAKGLHLAGGGEANFKKHSMDGLAAQLILESWFREPVHLSSLEKFKQT
jgi:putative Holliday junction resolvase